MSIDTSAKLIKESTPESPYYSIQSGEEENILDKISSIEIDLSRDKTNDTCIVTCVKDYPLFELFHPACIEYPEMGFIKFQGVCTQIETVENLTQYTIASPSILLTRNECKTTFTEPTKVNQVLTEILPTGFEFETEVDTSLFKSETFIGKIIMSALEEIAEFFKLKLFVIGWKVYIKEEHSAGDLDRQIYFHDDFVRNITNKLYGGPDIYTKVVGRGIVDNTAFGGKRKEVVTVVQDVFESTVEIVDVLTVEDNAYVTTTDDLRNKVNKRVMEIREASLTKEFELRGVYDVRPLDMAYIQDIWYEVVAVQHYISVGGEKTVITVCEALST